MNLSPEEIAYEEAHIHENKAYQQIIAISVFGVFAFVSVIVRLIARKAGHVPLALDDYLIIIAMFFGIGLVITAGLTTTFGVGKHLVAVPPPDLIKFGQASLQPPFVLFALQVAYPPTIALAKLSVLALYARVFNVKNNRPFNIALYITAAWIILWFIGVYLDVFLECRPLKSIWLKGCAPTYTTSVTTSIFNIISDVAVLILPQPILWSLQMPFPRKLGLSVVLLLGTFGTIVSIARIPILKSANGGGAADITFYVIPTLVFTVIEPMVAIICACLPVMQALVRRVYASGFGIRTLQSLLRSRRSSAKSGLSSRGKRSEWSQIERNGSGGHSPQGNGSTGSMDVPLRGAGPGDNNANYYELQPFEGKGALKTAQEVV